MSSNTNKHSAAVEITIPFHDADPMNVVWHGHYAKYLELARRQLFDAIDYDYAAMIESGYSWPVVDMRIKYVKPIRFDQTVRIIATLREWEFRLKINYLIEDVETGEKLTKGHTIQVAVDQEGKMLDQSPAILAEKLGLVS